MTKTGIIDKSRNFADESFMQLDANISMEQDLIDKNYRLLETDNLLLPPVNLHVRALITSMDVSHSWAVPSLGIKLDAIPGRLNQVGSSINRPGTFFGQCSELRGVNHGFMPISIQAVDLTKFKDWLGH